ncbi:MAG: 4Fe-4S dicluster domain-containing protein [Desulfobacteraceae bacterium]|nr:MAG: 4Fe-4S dicluster domain-containing protein [Desulfobacteraceae bacterium]
MITAIVLMGGMGILIGAMLAVASKIFYVYVDPKIEAVEAALPGANCGGCGLPGCSANAAAIVAGRTSPNSCVAGGAELAGNIAAILGVSVEAKEPDIAKPGCYYGVQDADLNYLYSGLKDCRAVALLGGGMKVCRIGCLGLGTCAAACPFGAITMGTDNLPVVDEKKCTGCGTCERVCPKHIINLSSVTRRILREYTTEECTTPCQRACPAGIDIREYIRQITLGNYQRSVQVIKERNPFPTVIGRICPRPCETECRRQLADEPVAINYLKRFVADYEKGGKNRILPYKAPETGRRIAVIGGGVEGLSTAFFTARLGHSPTVYEATDRLGGLLRSAIARERLPLDILDWDIEGIKEIGVSVETGKSLGKDITIAGLLNQGFECVYLATGGWDSRQARWGRPGTEHPVTGLYLLVDMMKAEPGKIPLGSDVVISGGGKLALDAAKLCRKRGAERVVILFRESWEDSPVTDDEVKALEDPAIRIRFRSAVCGICGEQDRLTGVELVDLNTSAKEKLPAAALILPSGRFPELLFKRPGNEADAENRIDGPIRWEGLEPYKRPDAYGEMGLLAESDPLSDYSAAIKAIGAGRRGAASIHLAMYNIDSALPDAVIQPSSVLQDVDCVESVDSSRRNIMPLCSPKDLAACRELEKGFTEEAARNEAVRCLQCGLICYERNA